MAAPRATGAPARTLEDHARFPGTLAAVVFCVLHGARIVRVHDVRATRDALAVVAAMEGTA